jgi:hypothetical protein
MIPVPAVTISVPAREPGIAGLAAPLRGNDFGRDQCGCNRGRGQHQQSNQTISEQADRNAAT